MRMASDSWGMYAAERADVLSCVSFYQALYTLTHRLLHATIYVDAPPSRPAHF